jgi:hypothetical protein
MGLPKQPDCSQCPMEILVKTVFKSMSSIKKPQRLFMMSLLSVLSVFQGRATYRNLSRYCPMSERRFSRWHTKDLDFSGFNAKLLSQTLPVKDVKIAAIDASFMSKSGQHTQGLGWFYNGSVGAAQRGLEISMISIVDMQSNTAYALDARQTLDKVGQSRTAYYTEQLVSQAPVLKSQGIRYVAADAYYSKEPFISPALAAGLHLVGKLRSDADLKWINKAPYSGKGRPKKFAGKVNLDDAHQDFNCLGELEPGITLYTQVVYSVMLKRTIRIVMLRTVQDKFVRQALLYSTDTELNAVTLVTYYKARFQIEFLFRDAKQHTGLTHCQARKNQAINNHVNASLTALNLLKIEDRQCKQTENASVISIASWKRKKFNQHLMIRLFNKLELDLNCQKVITVFRQFSDYGAIAA